MGTTKRKPKRLRRPNVPMPGAGARGGGLEARVAPTHGAGTRAEVTRTTFDYTYVKKDLRRIGVLAGSFIALLVALSFFIR